MMYAYIITKFTAASYAKAVNTVISGVMSGKLEPNTPPILPA